MTYTPVPLDVQRLQAELEKAEAERYRETHPGTTYPPDPVLIRERQKFYALDIGTSGAFLVRKADGAVFGIKGYGTADYRKGIGFAAELTGADVLPYRHRRGPFRVDMKEPAL